MAENGDILSGTTTAAQNLFSTTTGTLTVGGGAVTLSATGNSARNASTVRTGSVRNVRTVRASSINAISAQ